MSTSPDQPFEPREPREPRQSYDPTRLSESEDDTPSGDANPDGRGHADVLRAIEAIVMAATEPVEPSVLAQLLEQPAALVNRLCHRLATGYEEAGHGFQLVRVAGGWRFQTHPDMAVYVERFVLDGQRARLSGAALETLAIVAYKQPISRAQVASIRGVDPDGVLRTLQSRGYIDQVGRDPGPGQAVLWGTTLAFLEKLDHPLKPPPPQRRMPALRDSPSSSLPGWERQFHGIRLRWVCCSRTTAARSR